MIHFLSYTLHSERSFMSKRNVCFSNLTFCICNVGGLISKSYNKLQDQFFQKEINRYYIILLVENHLGYDTQIRIEGYKYFPICRSQSTNSRYYGGLGIFIKSIIGPGIKILENTHKDFQWLKLDKNFFNFNKNICLCLAYIIPSNSSYKQQGDEDIFRNYGKRYYK